MLTPETIDHELRRRWHKGGVTSIEASLHPKLAERYKKLFGSEYEQWLNSLAERPARTVRINTAQYSVAEFARLAETHGWHIESTLPEHPEILRVTLDASTQTRLSQTEEFHAGNYYVQDLASLLPVLALKLEDNANILDVTAAPGSKATQAALIAREGHVTACENDPERLELMQQVVAKQNLNNITCILIDGREVGTKYPGQFSHVILDTPCSGEGMFGQRPHLIKDWEPEHINQLEQLQIELLHSAWQTLKPGGTLVYSTCSYNPEENEAVLTSLLKQDASITVAPMAIKGIRHHTTHTEWQGLQFDPRLSSAIRLHPWDNNSIGFFLAKLRKAA